MAKRFSRKNKKAELYIPRVIAASVISIISVVVIGYLFILFSTIDFFPQALTITLQAICIVAFLAVVYLFLRYIESLKG